MDKNGQPRRIVSKDELWTPGDLFDETINLPTPDEFRNQFIQNVWGGQPGEYYTLEDSLAVIRRPTVQPKAYAFLDIDDLPAQLGTSLRHLQYAHDDQTPRTSHHDYGEGMFFDDSDTVMKHALIRLVKSSPIGLLPAEGISEIQDTVRAWHRAGIFVAFVSSAVDGTELSAVDFVGKYFNYSCDGIAITNGHYQLVDKGRAAIDILDSVGVDPNTPVINIDDLIFNTTKMRAALESYRIPLTVQTFQPELPSHFSYDSDSHREKTVVDTFRAANSFFENQLGRRIYIPLQTIIGYY